MCVSANHFAFWWRLTDVFNVPSASGYLDVIKVNKDNTDLLIQ